MRVRIGGECDGKIRRRQENLFSQRCIDAMMEKVGTMKRRVGGGSGGEGERGVEERSGE